mgnify:CR=1 FL=1
MGLPNRTLDPWNLFNPKKIIFLIFALALIQAMGVAMMLLLGTRVGAILSGFFGGLISSTAATAALARKSRASQKEALSQEWLICLSATLAMLLEGAAILLFGAQRFEASVLLIFLGPVLLSGAMIFFYSKKIEEAPIEIDRPLLEFGPLLKLSAFIIAVLAASKLLQTHLGESGLIAITFIASLFEIHGSQIANMQLHAAGAIGEKLLGGLIAISIFSSYLSKLFLVFSIGSSDLKWNVLKLTALLLVSLLASWIAFFFLT